MWKIHLFTGIPLQIYSGIAASFGMFSYGVQRGWTAPAIAKLQSNESSIPISSTQAGWIASLELITLMFSAIFVIQLLKYISAKTIIRCQIIPSLLSWIVIAFGRNIPSYYTSRILCGVVNSCVFSAVPIYISEISHPRIRGGVMSLVPIGISSGFIFSYLFAYKLSLETFATIAIAIPIINALFVIYLPESPYYLIFHNQYEEGKKNLEKLNGTINIEHDYELIRNDLETQKLNPGSWKEVFSHRVNRRTFVRLSVLSLIQEFVGAQCVGSYIHSIVEASDIDISVEFATTLFAVVQLVTNSGVTLFMDTSGRKKLGIIGCVGICITTFILGVYFLLQQTHDSLLDGFRWIPLINLYLFIFFYCVGLNYIVILLAGEMYPTNIKNYGIGLASVWFGFFGFIINQLFQIMYNLIGLYIIFWMFSISAVFGCIFIYVFIPETKQKSLAEIQIMLNEKSRVK